MAGSRVFPLCVLLSCLRLLSAQSSSGETSAPPSTTGSSVASATSPDSPSTTAPPSNTYFCGEFLCTGTLTAPEPGDFTETTVTPSGWGGRPYPELGPCYEEPFCQLYNDGYSQATWVRETVTQTVATQYVTVAENQTLGSELVSNSLAATPTVVPNLITCNSATLAAPTGCFTFTHRYNGRFQFTADSSTWCVFQNFDLGYYTIPFPADSIVQSIPPYPTFISSTVLTHDTEGNFPITLTNLPCVVSTEFYGSSYELTSTAFLTQTSTISVPYPVDGGGQGGGQDGGSGGGGDGGQGGSGQPGSPGPAAPGNAPQQPAPRPTPSGQALPDLSPSPDSPPIGFLPPIPTPGSGGNGQGGGGGNSPNPVSQPPSPANPAPAAPAFSVGSSVQTLDQNSNLVIDGQTAAPGGPAITVSGTPIAVAPGGTALVVGFQTVQPLPAPAGAGPITAAPRLRPTPVPPVLTVGGSVVTANAAGAFVFGDQTASPGGPPITLPGGTVVSVAPGGTAAVVDGRTQPLAAATGGFVVGGQTLVPGGSAVTVDGTVLSLASDGASVVVGGSTQPVASLTARPSAGATGAPSEGSGGSSPNDGARASASVAITGRVAILVLFLACL